MGERELLLPFLALLALLALLPGAIGQQEANTHKGCALPSRSDRIVGRSELWGPLNASDIVFNDQEAAFRAHGPLSQLVLYKAWYYDGEWHDPGELKGLEAWYGHGGEQYSDPDLLLLGARRPHVPKNCTLYREEVYVRAELQWDHIMRWANFTTNLGRYCAWGFPDVANTTKVVAEAPAAAPGAYLAAFRGWEGKPLPPSLGGFQKRYISQLGFVWAQRNCSGAAAPAAPATAAAPSVVTERQAVQAKPEAGGKGA